MSVKRYMMDTLSGIYESYKGTHVRIEDYEALEKELAEVKAENEKLRLAALNYPTCLAHILRDAHLGLPEVVKQVKNNYRKDCEGTHCDMCDDADVCLSKKQGGE